MNPAALVLLSAIVRIGLTRRAQPQSRVTGLSSHAPSWAELWRSLWLTPTDPHDNGKASTRLLFHLPRLFRMRTHGVLRHLLCAPQGARMCAKLTAL